MSKDKHIDIVSTPTPTIYDPFMDKTRPVTQVELDELLKGKARTHLVAVPNNDSAALTPVQIRRLATAIWGNGWTAGFAVAANVTPRTVQRWFTDETFPANIANILCKGALTREREIAQIVLSLVHTPAPYQQMDSTGFHPSPPRPK